MDDPSKKPKVVEGVFYANFKYRFIDDNPDVGLDLEKPLIEIQ